MAKKGLFGKRKSTAAAAAQRMVLGGLPQEEEELMQSPARMVLQSFVHDKVAMTGLILFLIIFLCCIILPFFYPIQLSYQDVTQSNVAPGFGMLSVPSQLQGNAQMVSSGSTFSVGIDKDGNVYEWGTFPTEKLKNIPSSSEMGKLTQISAGLDHVLAVNEEGQLFTWGNDRMGLNILPVELQASPQPIKQISAGYQISLALTESGRLYNWGSAYLLNVSVPSEVQGNIAKFDDNTNIVMALTNDGEVVPLSTTTSVFTNIPEEIQGNVVDIALTDEPTTALDETIQAQILKLMNDLKREMGTSILFITHDLGVIHEMADEVAVMYCGQIVEKAPARTIFHDGTYSHPYTEGLMTSIPQLNTPKGEKLDAIPGSVPNPLYLPQGCKFAPRCKYCTQKCQEAEPTLHEVEPGHVVRCFYPEKAVRKEHGE